MKPVTRRPYSHYSIHLYFPERIIIFPAINISIWIIFGNEISMNELRNLIKSFRLDGMTCNFGISIASVERPPTTKRTDRE